MKISIILPVLNERASLPLALHALAQLPDLHEIIVVDGGSTDGTREWLASQSFAHVIDALPGRGNQLNAGGWFATGDVLLFLHADSRLPADALQQVNAVLADKAVVGGGFLVRFAEHEPAILRAVSAGINLRTRISRTATGDQALFARSSAFAAVGGFAPWPLFEDVDFVQRLKRLGRFAVVPAHVATSARRYVAFGVLRTVFLMYALRLAYWMGIAPATLHRWFGDVRSHLVASQYSRTTRDKDGRGPQ